MEAWLTMPLLSFPELDQVANKIERANILKMRELHEVHTEHPEYTKGDLRMVTGMSPKMVRRYWEKFVTRTVCEIRLWDEVMS